MNTFREAEARYVSRIKDAEERLAKVKASGAATVTATGMDAPTESDGDDCEAVLKSVKQGNKLARQTGLSRADWEEV